MRFDFLNKEGPYIQCTHPTVSTNRTKFDSSTTFTTQLNFIQGSFVGKPKSICDIVQMVSHMYLSTNVMCLKVWVGFQSS